MWKLYRRILPHIKSHQSKKWQKLYDEEDPGNKLNELLETGPNMSQMVMVRVCGGMKRCNPYFPICSIKTSVSGALCVAKSRRIANCYDTCGIIKRIGVIKFPGSRESIYWRKVHGCKPQIGISHNGSCQLDK
jgi:hypothetical protein